MRAEIQPVAWRAEFPAAFLVSWVEAEFT